MTFDLDAGATLLASTEVEDYPLQVDVWGESGKILSSFIYAKGAENITLMGRGTKVRPPRTLPKNALKPPESYTDALISSS